MRNARIQSHIPPHSYLIPRIIFVVEFGNIEDSGEAIIKGEWAAASLMNEHTKTEAQENKSNNAK